MQAVHGSSFEMDSTFSVVNIPDAPIESLEVRVKAAGTFTSDQTADMETSVPGAETTSAMLFDAMATVMSSVKGDMTLTIELPADLGKLSGDMKLPEQLELGFRMIDGVAYINLADIAAVEPKAGIPPGWVGIDLSEFYSDVLPQQMAEMPSAGFDITGLVTELGKPENIARFAAIERLADAEIDGQAVAVFSTTIDYQALMDIEMFRKMFNSIVTAEGIDDEGAANAIDTIRQMYAGMSVVVTESIGLEDKRVHSTEMVFGWDLTYMPGIQVDPAPVVTFTMQINNSAFNPDFTVEVPEDVMMLPIKSMLLKQ